MRSGQDTAEPDVDMNNRKSRLERKAEGLKNEQRVMIEVLKNQRAGNTKVARRKAGRREIEKDG